MCTMPHLCYCPPHPRDVPLNWSESGSSGSSSFSAHFPRKMLAIKTESDLSVSFLVYHHASHPPSASKEPKSTSLAFRSRSCIQLVAAQENATPQKSSEARLWTAPEQNLRLSFVLLTSSACRAPSQWPTYLPYSSGTQPRPYSMKEALGGFQESLQLSWRATWHWTCQIRHLACTWWLKFPCHPCLFKVSNNRMHSIISQMKTQTELHRPISRGRQFKNGVNLNSSLTKPSSSGPSAFVKPFFQTLLPS